MLDPITVFKLLKRKKWQLAILASLLICSSSIQAAHVRRVADVNGDGKADIVAFGISKVLVSLSDGTKFLPQQAWISDYCENDNWSTETHIRTLGDVNGDGKADIVAFGYSDVLVSLSNGKGFDKQKIWVGDFSQTKGWKVERDFREVRDVNGDGLEDIIAAKDGNIYCAISNGKSFGKKTLLKANAYDADAYAEPTHHITFGDMNGDNKADVVYYMSNGVTLDLSIKSGYTRGGKITFGRGWHETTSPRRVADVDGNGNIDLIGFAGSGVIVKPSGGNQPVRKWVDGYGLNVGGWETEKHVRRLADVNGDGADDAIGFGNTTVYVSLSTKKSFSKPAGWIVDYGYDAGWRVTDKPLGKSSSAPVRGSVSTKPLFNSSSKMPKVNLPKYSGASQPKKVTPDKVVSKKLLPSAGSSPQLVAEMKGFIQNEGTLNLASIGIFKSSAFSNISIQAPQIARDGSVTGTTTVGGKQAPVLLQHIPGEGPIGHWVVAFKLPASKLSDLVPGVGGTVADKFQFRDVIMVFAPKSAEVDSKELAPTVRKFYEAVYGSEPFKLEVNQGIGMLASAKPLGPVDFVMKKIGITNPQIVLRGTLLKDYEVSSLRDAKKEGKLTKAVRKGLELRADFPGINLKSTAKFVESGPATLVVSGTPSVGIEYELTLKEDDGTKHKIDFSLSIEKQKTGVQFSATGKLQKASGVYENAFGINGLDMKKAVMTMNFDTSQSVGFGLGGELVVGGRDMNLAGAFKINIATGLPTDALFEGSIDEIHLKDMVTLANLLGSATGAPKLSAKSLPELYLKKVHVRFAPKEGNEALGIEQGFALKGELYALGKQMAMVDATITTGEDEASIKIRGDVEPINLDIIALKRGKVDINLTADTDPYFRIDAAARVLLKETSIKIDIDTRNALCKFTERVSGVYTAQFSTQASTVGKLEWQMEAVFQNELGNTIENDVNKKLNQWAKENKTAFDKANGDVNAEQKRIKEWEGKLKTARAKAQKDLDKHLVKVKDAKATLNSLVNELKPLKTEMDDARKKYDKASKFSPKKAFYGGKWRTAQGLYLASSKGLKKAEQAVEFYQKEANKHGVEANPEVIFAKGKVETYRASLKVASGVLLAAEKTSGGSLKAAMWLSKNSGKLLAVIQEIRMKSALSTYKSGGNVSMAVTLKLQGKPKVISMTVSSNDIAKNRIPELLFKEIKKAI